MRITKSYLNYASLYDIGKLAYFIEIDEKKGYFVDEKKLVEDIFSYNVIFIIGDVFKERDAVKKLCSLLIKNNNNVTIHSIGDCVNIPIGLGMYTHNIKYHVLVQNNIELERKVITWFIKAQADFLFNIDIESDIDNSLLIANEYEIPYKYVTMYKSGIVYGNELKELINTCLKNNVNFLIDFGEMFWPVKEEKVEEDGDTYYDILEVKENEEK